MSVPASPPRPATQVAQALLSPWARLALLVLLLASVATGMLVYEPYRWLSDGMPGGVPGESAAALFALAYGVCAVGLVPRPVLNLAAGVLFGATAGTVAALGGTVLGAALSFALVRLLGQDALRPLLRGRWLTRIDRQLSGHGFRSMLVLRLVPGVPFAASNYAAAVSRMPWLPFVLATALGSLPNTAAYAVAGSSATDPMSPVFLGAFACVALPALAVAVVAWRRRARLRSGPPDRPVEAREPVGV
ncbi:TVP38/TMEM64 family protein [Streptomyces sp. NPDC005438]|uniref:TVP38/TMEM64 family protein n=1 Tax=Streptomyces sp. NPDC005438 TaxID=3156880 RepID=UPI0033B14DAC